MALLLRGVGVHAIMRAQRILEILLWVAALAAVILAATVFLGHFVL